jgi:subtilisin family serine protease
MRLTLLFLAIAHAQLRVAVVDTGVDTGLTDAPLCRPALKDSSNIKHGTSVVDLIAKNAGTADYCIESFRVFDPEINMVRYLSILSYLVTNPPDVLNLSMQGSAYSPIEAELIKELLDKGVTVLAAAGNRRQSVSSEACNVYPACDDPRIIIVGTYDKDSGSGDRVNIKTHQNMGCIGNYCLRGTSQATAIETGRFIHFLKEKSK